MEHQPNETYFCKVTLDGFKIECLPDVVVFWKEIYRIGNILLKDNGFVIYPLVTVDELQKGDA